MWPVYMIAGAVAVAAVLAYISNERARRVYWRRLGANMVRFHAGGLVKGQQIGFHPLLSNEEYYLPKSHPLYERVMAARAVQPLERVTPSEVVVFVKPSSVGDSEAYVRTLIKKAKLNAPKR